jgi:uncharacterized membrane protein YgaE (UPF0421/DUF939 family)
MEFQPMHLPTVGRRTIKTLLSVAIIIFAYTLLDRNPCFACIGAVFGMGNKWLTGLQAGGNRSVGTLVGGIVAMLFYNWYHGATPGLYQGAVLLLALFVLLLVSQLFGVNTTIQPGSVVLFVVLCTVTPDRFVKYTIDRIIDTAVGVGLSLAINKLWPAPADKAAE